MPKPRKAAASQTLFSIGPWQHRSEKREDTAKPGDVDYTVVHEDLIKIETSAKGHPSADSSQQKPDQVIKSQSAPTAAATGGGWRTKKLVQQADGEDDVSMLASIQDLRSCELLPENPIIVETTAIADALQEHRHPIGGTTIPSSSSSSLAGTALVVLLGGSRLVGNFTLLDQPSITYPLHGKEITSYRECTRDPEWSIVKLHLLRLPNRELPREIVLLAERTGGDAMTLRSPVEWQGDEVEAFAEQELKKGEGGDIDNDGFVDMGTSFDCVEGLELEFECHRLLIGAAADAELSKVMPGAVGIDAMINIGPMKLTWKKKVQGGGSGVYVSIKRFEERV
ncbi:hypothetical protein Ndes2437B_g06842 [Nannochloris sp. 'desiccata']